ncbi:hypothetical protein SDRG_00194 [Saprolegnia diclina VS20]|uniref:FYVE-type domain-containing protein n=1 Tax=Saprolegnia diclina (strain VS20) TaxID=1156394 RepID=T0QW91_SAPDV|nr:hypothetical protein SDRG_00194 [Saprolegnia diclina VS20]EQC42459.1 hypothetical protein SDRG_00194 [Saprolegnia diclina VS20]|eukprot:XP_008603882.1 hypothetical protein SDRG_00194 [Saprolegnia diclina VS20]
MPIGLSTPTQPAHHSMYWSSRKPAAATTTTASGPWGFSSNIADLSASQLGRRGRKLGRYMHAAIQRENDAVQLKRVQYGSRAKVSITADSKAHVQYVHCAQVLPASIDEVLRLFWTPQWTSSDALWHAVFADDTAYVRSVAQSDASCAEPDAEASSSSSSSSTTISTPTAHHAHATETLAAGLHRLRYEESARTARFVTKSKPKMKELLYLEHFARLDDGSYIWLVKSIDDPDALVLTPLVRRLQNLMMACHIQAVGDRTRLSFLGGYCFVDGLQDAAKRFLLRAADAWEHIPRLVVGTRLADYLVEPALHEAGDSSVQDGCRVCLTGFSVFLPAVVCRLCDHDVCASCSVLETTRQTPIALRVCATCVDAIKVWSPIRHRRRPAQILSSPVARRRACSSAQLHALSSDLELAILLQIMAAITVKAIACSSASVHLATRDGVRLVAIIGPAPGDALVARAIDAGGSIVDDVLDDMTLSLPLPADVRFYRGQAIYLSNGVCIGAVSVADAAPRRLDAPGVEHFEAFAETAARLIRAWPSMIVTKQRSSCR